MIDCSHRVHVSVPVPASQLFTTPYGSGQAYHRRIRCPRSAQRTRDVQGLVVCTAGVCSADLADSPFATQVSLRD